MKLIYTNQKKAINENWNQDVVQTNHKEPNSQDNYGSNMGRIHHFPLYSMFYDWWQGLYQNNKFSWNFKMKILKIPNFSKYESCIFASMLFPHINLLIEKLSINRYFQHDCTHSNQLSFDLYCLYILIIKNQIARLIHGHPFGHITWVLNIQM